MSGIGNSTTNVQTLRRAIDAAERQALDPLGLTVAQFELLDILARDPGIPAAWIAARMNVSKQNVATMLSTLTIKRLITRSDSAPSGRALPIRLTPPGRKALEAAREAVGKIEARFTGAFGRAQAEELNRLLAIGLAAFPNERLAQIRAGVDAPAEGVAA